MLERVSAGEDGYDADGNSSGFGATFAESGALAFGPSFEQRDMDSRAVSEDGSRIVFATAEPLSPAAINDLANAYEWHEGSVSLVSTGSATRAVENPVISSSGRDVFFTTTQGLVPQDTDGQADVYDARLGGGFPPVPAEQQPCSGDACQGPLTNPAPLLVPGSVSQAPGGNLPAPAVTPTVKPKPKSKPVSCKKGFTKKHNKCVKHAVKKAKKPAKGRK
jgi:hypothetical protein